MPTRTRWRRTGLPMRRTARGDRGEERGEKTKQWQAAGFSSLLSPLFNKKMTFQTVVFYFFAGILLFAALRVITARNPVHAALFLVLAFFTSAGIWIQLHAEFLAIALVLVYVGAVMVLFLFVVMMLDINIARMRAGFWSYLPLGAVVALLLVIEMGFVVTRSYFGAEGMPAPEPLPPGYSNTKELGRLI